MDLNRRYGTFISLGLLNEKFSKGLGLYIPLLSEGQLDRDCFGMRVHFVTNTFRSSE